MNKTLRNMMSAAGLIAVCAVAGNAQALGLGGNAGVGVNTGVNAGVGVGAGAGIGTRTGVGVRSGAGADIGVDRGTREDQTSVQDDVKSTTGGLLKSGSNVASHTKSGVDSTIDHSTTAVEKSADGLENARAHAATEAQGKIGTGVDAATRPSRNATAPNASANAAAEAAASGRVTK